MIGTEVSKSRTAGANLDCAFDKNAHVFVVPKTGVCRTVFTPVMSVFRTDASFQNHLKKGILLNPTDYILPTEICAMVNVVLDAKNQSFKLCSIDGADSVSHSYHTTTYVTRWEVN